MILVIDRMERGASGLPVSFWKEFLAVFAGPAYTAADVSTMFVIVDIAGFQEKVTEGDALQVPLLDAEAGATVKFDKVYLVAKSDDDVTIGAPTVAGAMVEAKVIGHGHDATIRVFKMKRRKRYRRVHGHRTKYTEIEITKITA
jgi:large subunit ribosomal protein L21